MIAQMAMPEPGMPGIQASVGELMDMDLDMFYHLRDYWIGERQRIIDRNPPQPGGVAG